MQHIKRAAFAAIAVFGLSTAAVAQDEDAADGPATYTDNDDGTTTHIATGASCPGAVGDLILAQVLSFDRDEEHLGLACQYASEVGATGTLMFLQNDIPELVGPGNASERWNIALFRLMNQFPNALPIAVDGLGADADAGLRAALFEARSNGVSVQSGTWSAETDAWTVRAESTFLGTVEGWTGAAQLRQAVLDAKSEIEDG